MIILYLNNDGLKFDVCEKIWYENSVSKKIVDPGKNVSKTDYNFI